MTARYRHALDVAASWLAGSAAAVFAVGFGLAVFGLLHLGAEASAAADALREIRDIARNATTKAGPQDGHRYECCGKAGRISRHESWCTERAS